MPDPINLLNAALAGRYLIEQELGEGGMATVYLADDLKHERRIALKVLKPELAAVVGGDRFLSEIKTTANLQHPHILPLFDSGEAGTFLWYAMPYIDGESLQDRLDREKQLPVEEAVSIAAKIAGALHAAHEQGIIHRDIKPANILLANGEPLVADFGIALAVQEAGGGRLTETGLSMGTPFYMSPEQATADRTPDARADIYSLGCVLYEMLAGEPPFTGSTAQAILGRVLTQPVPSVVAVRASVPAHVDGAIQHSLEKLPADRFTSAADFARAMRDPGSSTIYASGGQPTVAGATRTPARALLPWAVAVAAVLVAVGTSVRSHGSVSDPVPVRFVLEDRGELTSERGSRNAQVSADGRSIIYRGLSEGRVMLFHRSIEGTGASAIPGTADPEFHAISPDSRWLAFVGEDRTLKRVPLGGGAPTVMAEPEAPPIGLTWSSPTQIAMGMLAFETDWPGITTVSFEDPSVQRRTGPSAAWDGERWGMHHEPHALADGEHVLFLSFSPTGVELGLASLADGQYRILDLRGSQIRPNEGIVGVSRDVLLYLDRGDRLMAIGWNPTRLETAGQPTPVADAPSGLVDGMISDDGTLVMSRRAESFTPVLVDDRGQVIRPLWDEGVDAFYPRISPDGLTLAVDLRDEDTDDVWIYDFETESLRQAGLGNTGFPVWHDQGRRLAVSTDQERRDGPDGTRITTSGVLTRPIDFSEQVSSLADFEGAWRRLIDMSPDGRHGMFLDDKELNPALTRLDLSYVSLEGDGSATDFEASSQAEFAARFSPDGRWVAYTSGESGRPQVYVRPFPGPGARVQVSLEPAGSPVWGADGDRLYYRTEQGLRSARLRTTADGLRVESRERLFDLDFFGNVASLHATYEVHPEGFLLAIDETGTNGQIIVWTNWLHEIRALLRLEER